MRKHTLTILLAGASSAAFAGEPVVASAPTSALGSEVFAGYGVRHDADYGYLGLNRAINGNLDLSGWFAQGILGHGEYDYNNGAAINGEVTEFEAGIGYQWITGSSKYSLLFGANNSDHDLSPADPLNSVNGNEWGAKVKATYSTQLTNTWNGSLMASYSTAFDSYWSRGSVSRELLGLQVGPELIAMGNEEWDEVRIGLSVGGFKIFGLNTSLSAGYFDADSHGSAQDGLYGAIHTSIKF